VAEEVGAQLAPGALLQHACRRRGITESDRGAEEAVRYAIRHSVGATSLSAILGRPASGGPASGEIEMIQGGRVVDPSTAAGEVSIRRVG
jgi:hypothetical protein